MTLIRSLLAALALVPAAVAAQAAPPPSKTTPAPAPEKRSEAASSQALPPVARDLARALTPLEAWRGIMDGYASSLSGQIAGALSATGKQPPPDLQEKVRSELDDAVKYEQAVDMQARALAGRFSADELRALETFYRTGPGKKLLDQLPEIARQVNDELRARLSERVPRIVERFAPSVPEGGEGAKPAEPPKAQGRTPAPQGGTPPRR